MYGVQFSRYNQSAAAERKLRATIGEYAWYKLPESERNTLIEAEKQRKYRNITTEYNGIRYHSALEAKTAFDLDCRKKVGEIKGWDRQVRIPLVVNGEAVANYYVDFVVYHNDGMTEYLECKGLEMDVWKLKWRIFEAMMKDRKDVKLTVLK